METNHLPDVVLLIDLENSLQTAARALRHAWRITKHGGMEATAKELADTVLDVETAAQQASTALAEHRNAHSAAE
jgi:hypothetical protein